MNNKIQISSIIIVIKILYILTLLTFSKNMMKYPNIVISSIYLPSIFILFVMYLTKCELSFKLKTILTIIKLIGIIFAARICVLNFKYYIFGCIILGLYYIVSDIKSVYSCDIKDIELLNTFIISSIIYYIIYKNKLLLKV